MNAITELGDRRNGLGRLRKGPRTASFRHRVRNLPDSSFAPQEQENDSVQSSVRKAASIGAGLTGVTYAAIGISAAQCAINGGAPLAWSVGTGAVFLLIGLCLGTFVGAFMGKVEAEQKRSNHT